MKFDPESWEPGPQSLAITLAQGFLAVQAVSFLPQPLLNTGLGREKAQSISRGFASSHCPWLAADFLLAYRLPVCGAQEATYERG